MTIIFPIILGFLFSDTEIKHLTMTTRSIVTEVGHKQVAVVNIYAPNEGREKVVFYTEQ